MTLINVNFPFGFVLVGSVHNIAANVKKLKDALRTCLFDIHLIDDFSTNSFVVNFFRKPDTGGRRS